MDSDELLLTLAGELQQLLDREGRQLVELQIVQGAITEDNYTRISLHRSTHVQGYYVVNVHGWREREGKRYANDTLYRSLGEALGRFREEANLLFAPDFWEGVE